MKRIRGEVLDRGGLDLAQEHLELVDRATETQHERLRALTRGAGGVQRAELLETRELGGRVTKAPERQRRGKAATQHGDTLLKLLQPASELVLEILRGHLVEALHLGLERAEVALHELRGLLERVALRQRLADADHLLHRV